MFQALLVTGVLAGRGRFIGQCELSSEGPPGKTIRLGLASTSTSLASASTFHRSGEKLPGAFLCLQGNRFGFGSSNSILISVPSSNMLFYTSEFCRCLDFWNPCASEISINHWSLQRLESWFAKYLDPNIWFHNLCLDIHSLYRKLSKCITCSTFSDFWWNVKWLPFTHSDIFRLRESYTFTNINWIIKRVINLNPTCVDKINVMEACLHLSTSTSSKKQEILNGILGFWHHERSSLTCTGPVLGYIRYIQLTVWCRYTAKICGCKDM